MNKKLPLALTIILAFMLLLSFTGCYGNQITIEFDTMGGSPIASISVEISAESLTLPVPTKQGYRFEYWCYDNACLQRVDSSVIPEENTTFYANWSINLVAVTFISTHPITNQISRTNKYVSYGGNLPLSELPEIEEVDGFEAIWLTDGITSVTEPSTIYAQYSEKKISVNYFVDNQEYLSFKNIPSTTIQVPENPVKQGFHFVGWYYDAQFTERCKEAVDKIPNESINLYANFIDISESNRFYTYTSVGGSIKITGLTTVGKAQKELVIPKQINNTTVKSLGFNNDNANSLSLSVFKSDSLTKIVLPSTIETIGSFAFYGATALKEVIFQGNELISIGTGAFAGCKNLTSFDLPNSVTTIGKYCFAGITISEDTTDNIDFSNQGAWSNLNNWCKTDMAFNSISIKQNSLLTTIGDYAFFNLADFTDIILPKNLTIVNYLAFSESGLSTVVAYAGGNFIAESGAVYTFNGKTLVYYPINGAADFALKAGTTTIDDYAFYNNKSIVTILANAELLTVGNYAFYNTINLINFDNNDNTVFQSVGNYAFAKSKINNFIAPSSVTSIGLGAFKEATFLSTVTFDGNNINTISQESFYGCSQLSGITIPQSVETIGKYAFFDCTNLAQLNFKENSRLHTIDDYAFTNCISIATIALPSTIRTINKYAFAGISGKMNLDLSAIPAQLISLGDYAFSNTKITNFSINSNLKSLGMGLFKNCSSLNRFTITISDYITAIPFEMFYGCSALSIVTFPYTILHIQDYAFYKCTKLTDLNYNLSGNIGLLSIGTSSFEGCTLLKSDSTKRIMPITVTAVGERAFYGCQTITEIIIPKSVTILNKQTFAYCTNLTEIKYDTNGSLQTIGEQAFAYCTSLATARLPSALTARNDLDTLGCVKNPFLGCSALTTFILQDNLEFYCLDGIVYRHIQGGVQVYLYPTGKNATFAVGADITSIDRYAFYGTAVSGITFSQNSIINNIEVINLVQIGAYAFSRSKLGSASLSKRVYSIKENAFSYSDLSTLIIEPTFIDSTNENYSITNDGVTSNTLTVGDSAFKATLITTLTTPERLTAINNGAFSECYKLKTINFADSTTMSLEIGDYAFYGDSNITNLVLPQQLRSVGDYAFSNCFNMQKISFKYLESLSISLIIGKYAFSNNHYMYTASLPQHLSQMGEGVFSYNTRLAEIVFSATLNAPSLAISKLAFYGDNALKTLVLPDYVSSIGEKAFWKTKLESVTLGNNDSLTIGSYAFSETALLKNIYLPQSVAVIGEYAFYNSALESFDYDSIGNDITILDYAFYGTKLGNVVLGDRFVQLGKHIFANTQKLNSVTITGNISSIGDNAFENSSLNTITVNASLKSIGNYAFANTRNLNGIDGCFTNIGDYAFRNSAISFYQCSSTLESITIGVKSFSNCANLINITMASSGDVIIDDFAFAECDNLSSLKINGIINSIGIGIAYNNQSLKTIQITDSLGKYYCNNGALYYANADEIRLLQYPAGNTEANFTLPSQTLPSQTLTIDDYAFYGNGHLLSVIIPSDILVIKGADSFTSTNINLKIYVAENLLATYSQQWNATNVAFITTGLNGLVLKYLGNNNYSIIDYAGSATNLDILGYESITIDSEIIEYRIIQIEDYAFANNTSLQTVNIGSGINTIYNYAFANCSNLESVFIGDNVISLKNYAFANCPKLVNVSLGINLESIASYAFMNCHALNNIALPHNLRIIGDYAFSGATALTSIDLGSSLQSLGNNAFEYNQSLITLTLPASLKTINDNVFYECEKLTFLYVLSNQAPSLKSVNAFRATSDSLIIFVNENSTINYTGNRLWRECDKRIISISDICTIENYNNYVLQNISDNSYRLLSYLGHEETITIASNITPLINITEIGSFAISHFTKQITLSEGIIALNDDAFANATSLEKITLSSSLKTIGARCFSGLTLLDSLEINDFQNSMLQVISENAFYNTTAITSFDFPKNIETIGDYAFADNILESIVFYRPSEKSIRIGKYAFSNNKRLKEIIFDCVVSSLGDGAFSNCTNLEAIYFNSIGGKATVINPNATMVFANCNKLSIFVRTENVLNNFNNVWQNNYDKHKLCLKTLIAHDTEEIVGQENFVISLIQGSTNTASIINYLGDETIITFPSVVTIGTTPYTITKIGREDGYVIGSTVTKVIIPASVTEIGADAFRNSLALDTVEFSSDSVLDSIGKNAFNGCINLRNVNIPKKISAINDYAFANCTALDNITFDNLPNTTIKLNIKEYAFYNCSSLVAITLPLHTQTIDKHVFSGAVALKSAIFTEHSSLATIGEYAFKDTAISSIYLPSTVNSVANHSFTNCKNLRYVYLNRELVGGNLSLTIAGREVFDAHSSDFIKIYVPFTSYSSYLDTNWNIKTVIPNFKSGDYNYLVNASGNNTITLTNYLATSKILYIPSSLEVEGVQYRVTAINRYVGNENIKEVVFDTNNYVTVLNKYAFASCTSLEKIHLPDSITTIDDYAFSKCSSLSDIILPKQLNSIQISIFAECTSLTEIRLPYKINGLGNGAFASCTSLNRIIVDCTDMPQKLGINALYKTSESLIIVVDSNTLIDSVTLVVKFSTEWAGYNIIGKDAMIGDFIVEKNVTGCKLIQYNGNIDIDLTVLTLFGCKISEIAIDSIVDDNINITIDSSVTYYEKIANRVTIID